jgi:hypothetical protein
MRGSVLCPLAVLVGLGGCNPFWPPHGRGGLAETHPPARADGSAPAYAELATLVDQLEALKKAGAVTRFPGKVASAQGLVVRIQRALGGGLIQDAEADVPQLRGEIGVLAQQLHSAVQS